ncbi:MAG TPA: response regulator [Propionibacteriaceae bacterium]|jgi:CheY-like chemotaxis protein
MKTVSVLDVQANDTAEAATPDEPGAPATLRLLHVEDNPADALLMQEYIKGILPSITFDTATRLADVTFERAAAVDCCLLDLSLPDASGLDALVALRGMSEELPIIVLTGFDNMELGLNAVRDGADDYLLKNHVDGYTLERAVQYSIERRRLMMQAAKSAVEAIVATATTFAADAATEAAMQLVEDGAAASEPFESRAAPGTHEVSVRIDRDTSEFVLSCQSCEWESDRGSDNLHSWTARSLELTLLHHVAYESSGEGKVLAAAKEREQSTVGRRGVFSARSWAS